LPWPCCSGAAPTILHAAGRASPAPLEGSVNTAGAEDSPFIAPDGSAFVRADTLWLCSAREGYTGIHHFAARACGLDAEGNLYFVHHFYRGGTMIEADIYVARRERMAAIGKRSPSGSSWSFVLSNQQHLARLPLAARLQHA
jgi:hypothetical protein